jgi:hypothetical protein
MPISAQFQVTGVAELVRQLAKRAAIIDRASTRKAFREGAAIVGEEARRQAPRGRGSENPGMLRRSIIWFLGRKKSGRTRELSAFARVNVKSGNTKAPHGLIIEAGRGASRPKKKRALLLHFGKGMVFSRSSKAVVANPYFQRAVDLASPRAVEHVVSELTRIIGEDE